MQVSKKQKVPQIGEKTDIIVGGGVIETVTIISIDRDEGFILAQKNPAMIAGPQPRETNRVRWPRQQYKDDPIIDSEFIFFNDETGVCAFGLDK